MTQQPNHPKGEVGVDSSLKSDGQPPPEAPIQAEGRQDGQSTPVGGGGLWVQRRWEKAAERSPRITGFQCHFENNSRLPLYPKTP